MAIRGPLSHIDLSISDPSRSIPFYAAFFEALGYRRFASDAPGFAGPSPERAAWFLVYPGGGVFGVEVRPAERGQGEPVDRYRPGLHHLAFHAESPADVDAVHEAVRAAGGRVLDPPRDYGGEPAYGEHYYAVFFADPDGTKLEVVYEPGTNQ